MLVSMMHIYTILDPDASFCPCPCPVPSDIFSMGAAAAAAAGGLPRDIFLMGAAAAAAAGADKGTIGLGYPKNIPKISPR